MTDGTNLTRLIQEIQPDEIYNLAAMRSCGCFFLKHLNIQVNADGLGTYNFGAVRLLGLENKTRIYQAHL
jgi:GDPmannose 4,6-dehydratase